MKTAYVVFNQEGSTIACSNKSFKHIGPGLVQKFMREATPPVQEVFLIESGEGNLYPSHHFLLESTANKATVGDEKVVKFVRAE